MKKYLPILISSCAVLSLIGTVMASSLPVGSPASTWVKLDATNVYNKPYQVNAHGDTLLAQNASCSENEEKCEVFKMEATPFSKNGKMHVSMYYYDDQSRVSCEAKFDEIPFAINNDNVEIASASYKTEWVLTNTFSEDDKCPASTITLNISPLAATSMTNGYEFKISESK
jgi:hypothetical protein